MEDRPYILEWRERYFLIIPVSLSRALNPKLFR
jgi:hypothetical protein